MQLSKVPKFKDMRGKLKVHAWKRYENVGIAAKSHIVIHHSMTKTGSAEAYARFHVETNGWCGIAYHIVIEQDGTVKYCNDLGLKTYHVGNHNRYCIGIVLTGDFRGNVEPTAAQNESLRNVIAALKVDAPNARTIKGHQEMEGYAWKDCPSFDFRAVLAKKPLVKPAAPAPLGVHTVQEGETYYSIAKELENVSVEQLIAWNGIKPESLRIGDRLTLVAPKAATTVKPVTKPKPVSKPTPKPVVKKSPTLPTGVLKKGDKGDAVKKLQTALNTLKFNCGKADGIYGEGTKDAVYRFQSVFCNPADGVYGPKTRAAMLAQLAR
jgi:N-acetylmuramoyl-L-alanine amidase